MAHVQDGLVDVVDLAVWPPIVYAHGMNGLMWLMFQLKQVQQADIW